MERVCRWCQAALDVPNAESQDAQARARGRWQYRRMVYCGAVCAREALASRGLFVARDPSKPFTTRSGALGWARRHYPPRPCERCGETRQSCLHHKNRDFLDNRLENLERLCVWCHMKEHAPEAAASRAKAVATRFARWGPKGHR
jgi:hypothetical protein